MVAVPRQEAPWNGTEKCSGLSVAESDDLFFTDDEEHIEAGVTYCRDGCPRINECLIFALLNNERDGVWGGHSPQDRRAIRKRWPLRRGKQPKPEWRLFEPGEPSSWYPEEELGDADEES